MKTSITPGIYRHYKGGEYHIFGTARHSENEETVVVYRALYGEQGLWVRPLEMFSETVNVNGEEVLRFTLVEEDTSPVIDFGSLA